MIDLYCRKNIKTKEVLCDECRELLQYANFRLDHCRFGENKPNCGGCKIHCYKKENERENNKSNEVFWTKKLNI